MESQLIDELYDAWEYLNICERYKDLVNQYEENTESCKQKYLRIKGEKVHTAHIYLGIFYVSAVVLIMGSLIATQIKNPYAGSIIEVVIIAGIIAAIVVAKQYIARKKRKPEKNAMEFWDSVGSPTCVKNEETIEKIKKELYDFSNANSKVTELLPPDYKNDMDAVSYMIYTVENGLASSVPEALKLYIEQKHRWEMEAAIHGMAETMQRHNSEMMEYMDKISAEQRITNSRLADIEMLTFFNLTVILFARWRRLRP